MRFERVEVFLELGVGNFRKVQEMVKNTDVL